MTTMISLMTITSRTHGHIYGLRGNGNRSKRDKKKETKRIKERRRKEIEDI